MEVHETDRIPSSQYEAFGVEDASVAGGPSSSRPLMDSTRGRHKRLESIDSLADLDLKASDFGGGMLARTDRGGLCCGSKYQLFKEGNPTQSSLRDEEDGEDGEEMLENFDERRRPTFLQICFNVASCTRHFVHWPVFSFNALVIGDAILFFGWNHTDVSAKFPKLARVATPLLLVFLGMVYWAWYRVLFTYSSVEVNPPPEHIAVGHFRRCRKCSAIRPAKPHFGLKPYRAHHCKVCDKCILKMDHHCVFLSQCIGHMNYKYFCLFIFYAISACATYLTLSVPAAAFMGPLCVLPWLSFRAMYTALTVIFTTIILVLLIMFGGQHLKLILKCQTTIEHLKSQSLDHGQTVWEKLVGIFGPKIYTWLLPIGKPIDSGWEWSNPDLTSRQSRPKEQRYI